MSGRRRLRVHLTHTPDAFARYYGDEALAALEEFHVGLTSTGGAEADESEKGGLSVVSRDSVLDPLSSIPHSPLAGGDQQAA